MTNIQLNSAACIINKREEVKTSSRLFICSYYIFIYFLFLSQQCSAHVTCTNLELHQSHQLAFKLTNSSNQYTSRIPFQFLGRLIMVQALIDGKEGNFIFDTGASTLLLNERYMDQDGRTSDRTAYASAGEVDNVSSTRLDSFTLRDLYFSNLQASIVDLSNLESSRNEKITGIIGYSVFKDYEVFIDYQFRLLILTRLDKKGRKIDRRGISEVPFDSLDFKLYKHAIIIKGFVGLEELKLNLDTGAEINLLDVRLPQDVLSKFKILRRVNMIGVGDKTVEVLAGKFNGLICGPGRSYPMRTLLTSTDYIRQATNVRVDGVLGYEYLYLKRISINYKTKKIYFYQFKEFKP